MIQIKAFFLIQGFALMFVCTLLAERPVAAAAAKSHIVREDIEWLDVWLPNTNDHALPRVLLIGDSITRGYGGRVESSLKGTAYVSRMATSKSLGDPGLLQQVSLVLQEQSFDVIHFNNGLHGHDYTQEEYVAALPKLLQTFHRYAPAAKLVWASSTDVREQKQLDVAIPETERVIHRNTAVAAIVTKQNIPVDDLFTLVKDHPEYHASDGVHFNDAGCDALAAQVAKSIKAVLPTR